MEIIKARLKDLDITEGSVSTESRINFIDLFIQQEITVLYLGMLKYIPRMKKEPCSPSRVQTSGSWAPVVLPSCSASSVSMD